MVQHPAGDDSITRECGRCSASISADARFCPSCGTATDDSGGVLLCQYCGHTIELGHDVCAGCGSPQTAKSPPRTAATNRTGDRSDGKQSTADSNSTVDDVELAAFRQRLDPYLEHGWEIDRDDGNRVDLVYDDYGSSTLHVVLALFVVTFGWGNGLYALYSRIVRNQQSTVRATDDPQTWPTVDPRPAGGPLRWTMGVVMGLVACLMVLMVIDLPTNPIPWLWLGAAILATASLLPPVNRRIRDRGSITEFGWTRSTGERIVHDTVHCTVCDSIVDVAIERTFEKYLAFAGIPLLTTESDRNHYCEQCCKTAITTDLDRELDALTPDEEGYNERAGRSGDSTGRSMLDADER